MVSVLMEHLKPYIDKLEVELHKDHKIGQVLGEVEKKTGVKRTQLALGVIGLFCVVFLLTFGSELLIELISFAYPAYKSIRAIESEKSEDDTQWLMYWVVYSYISFCEFFIDIILWWFPFYFTAKIALLLWCMAPIEYNGSYFLYNNMIKPFMKKYGKSIEKEAEFLQKKFEDISNVEESMRNQMTAAVKERTEAAFMPTSRAYARAAPTELIEEAMSTRTESSSKDD